VDAGDSASAASTAPKHTKPGTGIPKTDLASGVQTSLDKADTALQSAPVTSVNAQAGGAVVLYPDDLSDTTSTHKFTSAAEIAKLAGVALGA